MNQVFRGVVSESWVDPWIAGYPEGEGGVVLCGLVRGLRVPLFTAVLFSVFLLPL